MCECETCNGGGRVLDHNKWYVDGGKWKRSFDEEISIECPDCNGTGETPTPCDSDDNGFDDDDLLEYQRRPDSPKE